MNNKNRSKVLLKTLNVVFDTHPDTRHFIENALAEICRNENLPVHQVFSLCFGFIYCCLYFFEISCLFKKCRIIIYELLCIVMTNQKVK